MRQSLLLFSLFCSGGLLFAQTGTGSIQGTVKDTTGAVLPGAKISVTQKQTARSYNTTTNDVGFYLIPSVQIGPYEIAVEATGMDTWKGELTLQVAQTAVVNPTMKVASTSTEIVVAGDVTPLVTTTSATLHNTLERARIDQLPLNTRNILNLITATTPGMEGSGNSPRPFGLRYATEFLQDGALMENRDSGFIGNRPPGIDTVAEFRVETNNSAARLSRPATVIATTKSGTNQLHGSAFETTRNNAFGVARARTDYYQKPPQLVRNEFGVSLGGPVYLPKLYNGKNRTFFFAAYEALRLRSKSTRNVTMPTAAMRQGDYSGLVDSLGNRYTLYDPWTSDASWNRTPFPNNQMPASRQSPISKYVNSITPLPTHPEVNPMAGSNWYGLGFSNQDNYTFTTRVDHRIGERDQIFFRASHAPNKASITNSLNGASTTLDGKANGYISETQNDNGVASWTHTFSPTLFAETVFTFSRDYWGQIPIGGLEDYATPLGLPNPFKGVGFPWIYGAGFNMNYYPGVNYTLNYAKIFVFDENLTKIHGRHEFQFGGRYRHELLDTLVDQQQVQGASLYQSGATSLYDPKSGSQYSATRYTGHDSANLYLGVAHYYLARFTRPWYNIRAREIAGYFQDNFKVNSRLTLNLGVRYEYNSPIQESNNVMIGFDRANKAVVVPDSTDYLVNKGYAVQSVVRAYSNLGVKYVNQKQAGIPTNFINKNLWDFGPRLGFAYRMGGDKRSTVLRGGYAIYAYPEPLRLWNATATSSIPTTANFGQNWNAADQSPDGLPNYFLRNAPTVIAGVNSSNVIDANNPLGISRGSGTMDFLNPDQPTARAHEWNFTLERELINNTSLKLGYVGTHATRQSQFESFNDAPNAYIWYATTGTAVPAGEYASVAMRAYDQTVYGNMKEFKKTGWSNCNSFTVEVQHKYSNGYAFQAYYVMSNAMRVAGDGWRDDFVYPTTLYMPGAVPTDYNERNRFLNYRLDTAIPKHRFNYNWLADLPFGKGKRFGNQFSGVLDRIIGGWQVAGSGVIKSNYWTLPTSNWNVGNVEIYGTKYPIQDCRTGVCYPGYLYWNGYIPANRINSYDANGKPNGVMGVPDSYVPSNQPFFPTPKNGIQAGDPNAANYETNYVWLPMKNGTTQRIAYNNNLNPWRNQYALGPMTFLLDASIFKSVRIKEGVFVRFNADFFNVLNLAGIPQPGSDGIIQMRNSANTPRQLQLTLRLTW